MRDFIFLFAFLATILELLAVDRPIPLSAPDTYFWDGKHLLFHRQRVAQNQANDLAPVLERMKGDAEYAMAQGPFSVTYKKLTPPSRNLHDFFDLSPYFWPNRILYGGRPYWIKDGRKNPEAESPDYDRKSFLVMQDCLQRLCLAYYFLGDERYAQRAALLIRTWFLDEPTRMNPHFRFSQTVPGLLDGLSLGLIRSVELVEMIDAAELIQESSALTPQDRHRWREWMREMVHWLQESDFGKEEAERANNHGTWHDAYTSALWLHVGEPQKAGEILSSVPKRRWDVQFKDDGAQPLEKMRSRSFEYCIYNLKGQFQVARLADRLNLNLWKAQSPKGRKIKTALDYLLPYATSEKKWEHEQLSTKKDTLADIALMTSIASSHYLKNEYLETLKKLPPLSSSHRLRVLWPESLPLPGE